MVTVYEKPDCKQCELTQFELGRKGIPFETRSLEDPANLAKVKSMGFLAAPVVVPPNGDPWAGFRPDLIQDLPRSSAG